MVRLSSPVAAQIGRLATPPIEAFGGELAGKAKDFYREVCRLMPWTVNNYRLEELTNPAQLRRNVAQLFRKYQTVKDPKVVDLLIYQGREILESVSLQHMQRHHLVSMYIEEPEKERTAEAERKQSPRSDFLKAFYGGKSAITAL
eukprot:jgi/Botrbrau1/12716/Bobra.67_1s0079.1